MDEKTRAAAEHYQLLVIKFEKQIENYQHLCAIKDAKISLLEAQIKILKGK